MKYLFVKIIFIVSLLQIIGQYNGIVYCQSKYHNSKKKTELQDNIPKPVSDSGAEQAKDEVLSTQENMGSKEYWTGILFYPKSKQPHDTAFEDKAFKILGDTFYKIKRIKLFGESIFLDKLKELGISEKSIILFPENVVGGLKDVQIIVVVMYMKNNDNVISVEVRLMNIEKGDFFKLSPDNFSPEEADVKIANIANSLSEKIVKLIEDDAKASTGDLNVSAVEYFEKGKSYNVANLYLQAKKEHKGRK
ncbi:hypothetical protein HY745_05590 [Candidatus Desantisbacteria bacterium]|nr:hypothetical protein [Candidatus Desantisbacteria bacterium]